MTERKYYIDNLRWLCVMMLFPYHIFMIYNNWGEGFYIKGADLMGTSTFIILTWPWFMPLLFSVAGISTAYALKKRGTGGYIKERATKLLIPLITGILTVIPAQTYFAERFHNGYTGNYFEQYILFFTKPTDLTGYTGGFTPGQLWFILYLLIISFAALLFILLGKKLKLNLDLNKTPAIVLPLLFVLPTLGSLVLDISGKSLGEYFVYFMLGYLLLSKKEILQKLEKYRAIFLTICLVLITLYILIWFFWLDSIKDYEIFMSILERLYGWVTLLALLGMGRKHLNASNGFSKYMSGSSFAVYLFHQTWIVAAAYYIFRITGNAALQIPLIFIISIPLTFASYEVCKRFFLTRFIFAIKK